MSYGADDELISAYGYISVQCSKCGRVHYVPVGQAVWCCGRRIV
jgi:hypothetical protein